MFWVLEKSLTIETSAGLNRQMPLEGQGSRMLFGYGITLQHRNQSDLHNCLDIKPMQDRKIDACKKPSQLKCMAPDICSTHSVKKSLPKHRRDLFVGISLILP